MTTWLANPEALWLLTLLPVLSLLGMWAWRRRRRALALLGSGLALHRLAAGRRWPHALRGMCLSLGLMALIVGIAGPQWGRDWTPAAPGRDLVVVLDLSRSMLAEHPSRQVRALKALGDLCDAVQRRGGHRLALVVFAAHARVVCPLTHDYDHFRDALAQQDAANPPPSLRPEAGGPVSGTRIGEGLHAAVAAHDPRFAGSQDILLVSDGDDPAADGEWATGAAAAAKARIPVHVVGVGDPESASPIPAGDDSLRHGGAVVQTRLEEKPLEEIARRTRGIYIPARTQAVPLGRWLREVIEPRTAPREEDENALPVYRQQYAWFFAPALGLLVVALVVGEGSAPRLLFAARAARHVPRAILLFLAVLLVSAGPAVEDLLRRGNEAFAEGRFEDALGEYTRAEAAATDPGLVAFNKAAALYRLGRHREAELHYRRCLDDAAGPRRAGALYDLGNCLLQQAGDRDARLLQQAVACYRACRRVAGIEPSLADDAAYNQELARLLWLKARATGGDEPPRSDQDDGGDAPKAKMQDGKMEPGGLEPGDAQGLQPGKDKQGAQEAKGADSKQPAPGRGDLRTLPDTDELVPLAAEDTAAYLERLAERIQHERHEHWRTAVPASPHIKDW
jgi:Ca-activated chloride channel family protein